MNEAFLTRMKPTAKDGLGVEFDGLTGLAFDSRDSSILSKAEEKAIEEILKQHVRSQGPWFKKNYRKLSPGPEAGKTKGPTRNSTGTMGKKAIKASRVKKIGSSGNIDGFGIFISLERVTEVAGNRLSFSESKYPFYYESGTKGPIFPKHDMFAGPVEWTGRPARGNVLVLRNKATNKKTGRASSVAGQAAHTPFARTAQSAPRNFNDIIARNVLKKKIYAAIAATP